MSVTILTPPASEPVSLAEAKTLLRIDAADEDSLLASLIATARHTVETRTGRALITRSLALTLNRWPHKNVVRLPHPPLITVNSVEVADASGTVTPLAADTWHVDRAGLRARLLPAPGHAWPAPGAAVDGIRVAYDAGYGTNAETVPPPLAHAVLLLVAHWYENRVPVVLNGSAARIPATVDALIAPYRLPKL